MSSIYFLASELSATCLVIVLWLYSAKVSVCLSLSLNQNLQQKVFVNTYSVLILHVCTCTYG